jgi:hypothetical protein
LRRTRDAILEPIVRIALWIFAGVLTALLLLCVFPRLTLKDLRGTSRGGELLRIAAVAAILLAVVLWNLFAGPPGR